MEQNTKPFCIAIHGGAGTILKSLMTEAKEKEYKSGLKAALDAGYQILENGGSSIDAVEAAVSTLEDFPLFNAGKGAVFTNKGTHEMDASIMDGSNLEAGAVSGVSRVKNPVQFARVIKEKSGHVFLSGIDAENYAQSMGLKIEEDSYFYEEGRYKQWQDVKDSDSYQLDHSDKQETGEKKFGTVGAVALDMNGNIAAATSTGGMTNKKYGRVGDTPMIGAGTYANNKTCAVSCTGHGEYFIRAVVAYDVSCLMEYKGLNRNDACEEVVNKKLVDLGGEGGLVALDAKGNICMSFNSEGMYRGFKHSKNGEQIEIYR